MKKFKVGDKVWLVLRFFDNKRSIVTGRIYIEDGELLVNHKGYVIRVVYGNVFDNEDDAKRRLIYLTLTT